jgi:hypothetical protein
VTTECRSEHRIKPTGAKLLSTHAEVVHEENVDSFIVAKSFSVQGILTQSARHVTRMGCEMHTEFL